MKKLKVFSSVALVYGISKQDFTMVRPSSHGSLSQSRRVIMNMGMVDINILSILGLAGLVAVLMRLLQASYHQFHKFSDLRQQQHQGLEEEVQRLTPRQMCNFKHRSSTSKPN
jgi:hypothetical protein